MVAITRQQICELLGLALDGEEQEFTRLSGFAEAGPDAIVFAVSPEAVVEARRSAAGLILAPANATDAEHGRVLAVADPKYAFAQIARWFDGFRKPKVHATALVDDAARLGSGVTVGAGSVVEADVSIGDGCVIGHNVVVHAGTRLGSGCVVQSGAVLGSTGFGYARGQDGRYLLFPQQGTLWIGDDVEIGANTTIDKGALGETRIGRGTKIDNLVHIAHNCTIGEDVIIAAQVGIAGSTMVSDGAILAGQVGLAEHVSIGPGVVVGAQGGVPTGKRLTGKGEVFWGTPARPIREYLKDLARLRRK